jgi:hypothetical protein
VGHHADVSGFFQSNDSRQTDQPQYEALAEKSIKKPAAWQIEPFQLIHLSE